MLTSGVSRVSNQTHFSHVIIAAVAVSGLLVMAAGGVAAAPSPHSAAGGVETVGGTGGNVSTNSSTPPHENPDVVSEEGDPDQVASYLSSQLDSYLSGSTVNLSAGEYEQARAILGDEYNETLQQYVDVQGDSSADTAAESYQSARTNTQELIALREEFAETRDSYEAAVAAGNTARARTLARELATLANQIDDVSVKLEGDLAEIENATGQEIEAQDSVRTIRLSTTETAANATTTQLVATRLIAQLNPTTFSFADPSQLSGQLRTANGTPVANETITLMMGADSYAVSTSATGNFSLRYRPTTLSTTATTVPVRYQPADDSPYLGSNTTAVGALTEQTSATVAVTADNYTAQYGTVFPISGTVTVGTNATVGGLPVVATAAGQQLGVTRTHGNGSFTIAGTLPSTAITPDRYTLQISLALEDSAIAGATQSVTLQLRPAQTQLTVNTTPPQTTDTTVPVTGTLSLQSGTPLESQTVGIYLNGSRVDTVETGPGGQYTTTLTPTSLDNTTNATLTARFDGQGTNLVSSEAATSFTVPRGATQSGPLPVSGRLLLAGGVGIAGALGILIFVVFPQWRPAWLTTTEPASPDSSDTTPASETSDPTTTSVSQTDVALTTAEERLAEGDSAAAVQLAYSGLRSALSDDLNGGATDTHWEFYQRCEAHGIDSLPQIKQLISVYETTMFAPTPVSDQDAAAAVRAVSTILSAE